LGFKTLFIGDIRCGFDHLGDVSITVEDWRGMDFNDPGPTFLIVMDVFLCNRLFCSGVENLALRTRSEKDGCRAQSHGHVPIMAACMAPSCTEAKGNPVSSLRGRASISARIIKVGPGLPVFINPTTPYLAMPVCTSKPVSVKYRLSEKEFGAIVWFGQLFSEA
jgi:hypothetical protein